MDFLESMDSRNQISADMEGQPYLAIANQLQWSLDSFPVSPSDRGRKSAQGNLLVGQSNLPMFPLIFSDLNILFPLPRVLSTSHSLSLLFQGENPCSTLRCKLRPNCLPRIVTEPSHAGLCVHHRMAPQDCRTIPPAAGRTVVNLLFRNSAQTKKNSLQEITSLVSAPKGP